MESNPKCGFSLEFCPRDTEGQNHSWSKGLCLFLALRIPLRFIWEAQHWKNDARVSLFHQNKPTNLCTYHIPKRIECKHRFTNF